MAGCGAAPSSSEWRFTWQSFCSRQSDEWQPFTSLAIAPEFLIQERLEEERLLFSYPRKMRSSSSPNRREWIEKVEKALQAIENRELEKVVIAKRVEIECEAPIDALGLFSALKRRGQTNFFLQPSPKSAFLGSSPERLYKREGRLVECDVLAGTRPLHAKEELLTSEKDLREFKIVEERIAEALTSLSQSPVQISPPSLACTPTVSHLHAKIFAELKKGVDDRTLLDALHPTPALGGWPKEKAALWQRENEPFARGLYGAPIGYIGPDSAEFAVAIRSCLVVDSRAYLYAGTGIVAGSDPALEWEESEQKLIQWRSLIHG